MEESTIEVSHEVDDTNTLYEAATTGCIAILNTLIQRDKLILHKLSLTNFTETPLHISSLLGHLDFTTAVLQKYPKLASEFDSSGRSPLHLASAEWHTEIVKALLCVNKDMCLARDQDGRIPLHLAAMRGRIEVIQILVSAYPNSVSELLEGDTVFHLCVKYYHLEALKLLGEIVMDIDAELFKIQNKDGNTILHLAAMLKQSETVKYIMAHDYGKPMAKRKNKLGFTALQVLEYGPKDIKGYEIRETLMELNIPLSVDEKKPRTVKGRLKKFMRYLENQGTKIEETQGAVMTAATLIATMSFQCMVNPPGGVWQQDSGSDDAAICGEAPLDLCAAGTAILGYYWPDQGYYRLFLISNTAAFLGSLVVIFLIIGGFPLQNKICTWLLTVAMSSTVVFTGFTYVISMYMVTPDKYLK